MTEKQKRSARAALIVAHRPDVFDPIEQAKITEQVIALRRLMTPWRRIGEQVDCSAATARRWYFDALAAEVNHDNRANALATELDTLNVVQGAWWSRAIGTALDGDGLPILDDKAASVVLKVMAQRARLMGPEAPIHVDAGDPAEVVAAAIVAHLARRSEQ
jgi:hypothetical protein